jgi:hypothetical protein
MIEFTIRNKRSETSILTLSKELMAQALKARPESVAIMLDMQIRAYKELTGKRLRIDHLQEEELAKHANAEPGPMGTWVWKSKYNNLPANMFYIMTAFTNGLSSIGRKQMTETLAIAEQFYDMVDKTLS